MDVLDKQISPEAHAKISVGGGKITMTAQLDTPGVDALVTVGVDADYFLDELAKKIPGVFDDAVLGLVKTALKAL